MRTVSTAAKKASLLLASTLAGLLLLELTTRVVGPPRTMVEIRERATRARRPTGKSPPRAQATVAMEEDGLYLETPSGWRLRPNTLAVIEGHATLGGRSITVETNSLGFRGPELSEKSKPRILFLGDSITLGDYLAEEDTFVRIVERLFREDGTDLETVNAGVGGVGLANEFAILMENGLRAEPDVVVLGFYLNDVEASPGVRVLRVPKALRWSSFAHFVARRIASWNVRRPTILDPATWREWKENTGRRFPPASGDPRKQPSAFNQLILDQFDDWGSAWSEEAWETMEPILVTLERQAELRDFRLLLLCFPVRAQVEAEFRTDFPQRRLAEIARSLGVPLLDLLPVLRTAHRRSREPLFYDHCHPTPHGSRLIAEEIHRFILENSAAVGRLTSPR